MYLPRVRGLEWRDYCFLPKVRELDCMAGRGNPFFSYWQRVRRGEVTTASTSGRVGKTRGK